jgi:hypothetical protein
MYSSSGTLIPNESPSVQSSSSNNSVGFGRPDNWIGKKTERSWRIKPKETTNSKKGNNESNTDNDSICKHSIRSAPTVMFQNDSVRQRQQEHDHNKLKSDNDDDDGDDDDDDDDEVEEEGEQSMSHDNLIFNGSMNIGDYVISTTKNKKYSGMDASMHSLLTEGDESKSRFSDAMGMWQSASSIDMTTNNKNGNNSNNNNKIIMNTTQDEKQKNELLLEESFHTAIEEEKDNCKKLSDKKIEYDMISKCFEGENHHHHHRPNTMLPMQLETPPRPRHKSCYTSTITRGSSSSNHATRAHNRPDEWIGGSSPKKPAKRSWKVKKVVDLETGEEESVSETDTIWHSTRSFGTTATATSSIAPNVHLRRHRSDGRSTSNKGDLDSSMSSSKNSIPTLTSESLHSLTISSSSGREKEFQSMLKSLNSIKHTTR